MLETVLCAFAEKVEEPTLTRTPTDKEVREGQKVRFDAAAKGVPKPAMKWYAASPPFDKGYFRKQ